MTSTGASGVDALLISKGRLPGRRAGADLLHLTPSFATPVAAPVDAVAVPVAAADGVEHIALVPAESGTQTAVSSDGESVDPSAKPFLELSGQDRIDRDDELVDDQAPYLRA